MSFWIRNIIIAMILIAMGYAFFANQDYLLALTNSPSQTEASTTALQDASTTKTTTSEPKSSEQAEHKTANAAADGLSNYYEKIYGSGINNKGPKIRNNIIFLPDPQGDLITILQAQAVVKRPYPEDWQGTTSSRPFRKGQTLYQKLAEYAAADGLDVIWWLNKDFIIKEPFRIEKDILATAYQVGKAVSGHFPQGITSYFCYRQRTLVFINEAPSYIADECLLLK